MRRFDDLLPRVTSSAEETMRLGAELARRLLRADVVALYGDLGSGKTVLTRGIGSALGIPESEINSPTFTILHEYASGSIPLYHFDAYRIESLEEFYDLGYEDYFFGDGISIVEWADRVEGLLPDGALRLRLEHAGESSRRVRLVGAPAPADQSVAS